MRSISQLLATALAAAGLAAAALIAVAGAARAQDAYSGKTVDELLELVRKRIEERSGEDDNGQAYNRFRDQKTREFAQRGASAATAWAEEPNERRDAFGRSLLAARARRAFGDFNSCNRALQTAYRKAQSPMQKQLAALELAKMAQLRGAKQDVTQWVTAAQKEGKNPQMTQWVQTEANKIARMGTKMREYKTLLDARAAAPRDPAAQWALCEHLRTFTDDGPALLQGGPVTPVPALLVDLYVNYEWLMQSFPAYNIVVTGGADEWMLNQAFAAKDVLTATQVATRLLGNPKNERAKSGRLLLDMAVAMREIDAFKAKALLTFRALEERHPANPAVAQGEAQQAIRELSADSKARAAAKAAIPEVPWE